MHVTCQSIYSDPVLPFLTRRIRGSLIGPLWNCPVTGNADCSISADLGIGTVTSDTVCSD